jgi:hypothetical protein
LRKSVFAKIGIFEKIGVFTIGNCVQIPLFSEIGIPQKPIFAGAQKKISQQDFTVITRRNQFSRIGS